MSDSRKLRTNKNKKAEKWVVCVVCIRGKCGEKGEKKVRVCLCVWGVISVIFFPKIREINAKKTTKTGDFCLHNLF